jgi:nicotinate-nucleotide adenylyltransferase
LRSVGTGVFGGTFDPPHNGHVALARAGLDHFALEHLVVLVVADPGHRSVDLDSETRLRLARAAFGELPRTDVRIDKYRFTVDSLRAGEWEEPIFLVGADEFADFLTWKEPDGVLELARLAVGTRPGYEREQFEDVLARLQRPERVLFFEIEPVPISSRELRERLARGDSIEGLVPPAVAQHVRELGLYRR